MQSGQVIDFEALHTRTNIIREKYTQKLTEASAHCGNYSVKSRMTNLRFKKPARIKQAELSIVSGQNHLENATRYLEEIAVVYSQIQGLQVTDLNINTILHIRSSYSVAHSYIINLNKALAQDHAALYQETQKVSYLDDAIFYMKKAQKVFQENHQGILNLDPKYNTTLLEINIFIESTSEERKKYPAAESKEETIAVEQEKIARKKNNKKDPKKLIIDDKKYQASQKERDLLKEVAKVKNAANPGFEPRKAPSWNKPTPVSSPWNDCVCLFGNNQTRIDGGRGPRGESLPYKSKLEIPAFNKKRNT